MADNTYGLDLPGAAGDYASTPDSAAMGNITDDLTIVVHFLERAESLASTRGIVSRNSGTPNRSWVLWQNSDDSMDLYISNDGTNWSNSTLSAEDVQQYVTDGKWLKVESLVDGTRTTKWYVSDHGYNWTEIDSDASPSNTVTHDNSQAITIGANGPSSLYDGKIGIVRVYAGDEATGTLVVDFDPSDSDAVGNSSWTSSATGEVWTLNGNAALYLRGTSVDPSRLWTPGSLVRTSLDMTPAPKLFVPRKAGANDLAVARTAFHDSIELDYILDVTNDADNSQGYGDTDRVVIWENPGTYIDRWWNDGGTFPTRRPTYNASDSDFNDQPSMTFDGSDNWLAVFHNFGDPNSPYMVFIVFKPTTINANERIFSSLSSLSGTRPELLYADATPTNWLCSQSSTMTGPAIDDNAVQAHAIEADSSSSKWWKNHAAFGSPTATGSTGNKAMGSGFLVGTDWNGGASETAAFKLCYAAVAATTPASITEDVLNKWQTFIEFLGVAS